MQALWIAKFWKRLKFRKEHLSSHGDNWQNREEDILDTLRRMSDTTLSVIKTSEQGLHDDHRWKWWLL